MTMMLYMDHHVPAAITEGLRIHGIDVLTCEEDGTDLWADAAILSRSTELGRVLFSQDADLLAITAEWQESGREFAGVIYAHQLRITIGQAVSDLDLVCHAIVGEELRNSVVYLPL